MKDDDDDANNNDNDELNLKEEKKNLPQGSRKIRRKIKIIIKMIDHCAESVCVCVRCIKAGWFINSRTNHCTLHKLKHILKLQMHIDNVHVCIVYFVYIYEPHLHIPMLYFFYTHCVCCAVCVTKIVPNLYEIENNKIIVDRKRLSFIQCDLYVRYYNICIY